MFKLSDKVVCVDDIPLPGAELEYEFPNGYAVKGKVYVVQDLREELFVSGMYARLYLVGLPVIFRRGNYPVGWNPRRFRKLEEIQAENRATLVANH